MIRTAFVTDAEAIHALFAEEVRAGKMLPRRIETIRAEIGNWVVAEEYGEVIGCVSLVYFDRALCEIRSLAVRPDYRGRGIGGDLIHAALSMARENGMRKVLALTRAADVFERAGFRRDYLANYPEKVWRDCTPCPFRSRCDEVAVIYDLSLTAEWLEIVPS